MDGWFRPAANSVFARTSLMASLKSLECRQRLGPACGPELLSSLSLFSLPAHYRATRGYKLEQVGHKWDSNCRGACTNWLIQTDSSWSLQVTASASFAEP